MALKHPLRRVVRYEDIERPGLATLLAPAQVGLAGGAGRVDAPDERFVRRAFDEGGVRVDLARDGVQRGGEVVQCFLVLRLGRLGHQALLHHLRPVDGRRVEAVVDQALGDVERAHTLLPLVTPGCWC